MTLKYADKTILSDIKLTLPSRKWVALLGPSGVGKTSLLRILAGIQTPLEKITGNITCDQPGILASHISMMAQQDLLLPWLSVLENATLKLKLRYHNKTQQQHIKQQAQTLLISVGLADALTLYPHQLSGGMRQRVALVRTLLEDKPIVLMDEPFSALDAITRYKLQHLARQMLVDKTVLFITHDPQEALRLADDIYLLIGQPATTQLFKQLSSPTPRSLDDETVIRLQAELYSALQLASIAI